MKQKWRLLKTQNNCAFSNMAIDKAVLVSNSKNKSPPTVRFYTWNPSAISIGYFQSMSDEVDLEACKNLGVEFVRRITGGGAVFHDKELTYSIVIPESNPLVPKNILESYRRICGAVIRGLEHLWIESKYAPINDIIVNNKKISGNAQTRKFKTVLQHGTVLTDVDVDKMFMLLKVPNEKLKDKMIADVKQRVTSIKHILGSSVSFDDVADAMKLGFEQEFDVDLVSASLTREELALSKKFERECFSTNEWNFRR